MLLPALRSCLTAILVYLDTFLVQLTIIYYISLFSLFIFVSCTVNLRLITKARSLISEVLGWSRAGLGWAVLGWAGLETVIVIIIKAGSRHLGAREAGRQIQIVTHARYLYNGPHTRAA